VIREAGGYLDLLRVEDEAGELLAHGVRSMEGLVGLMEMVVFDPAGRFLLAFRLARLPGRPLVQIGIPYLAVDDQGQTIGELRRRAVGLTGRSYELWNQGEAVLTVPSPSRSQPYPMLLRGAPVAMITEEIPMLAKAGQGTWTVRFSAPCPRLSVLALATYVATSRGHSGIPSG